ncbi:hypothetical protein N499_0535B, partial [Wolbachia pipientis wVitA]
ATKPFQCQLLS